MRYPGLIRLFLAYIALHMPEDFQISSTNLRFQSLICTSFFGFIFEYSSSVICDVRLLLVILLIRCTQAKDCLLTANKTFVRSIKMNPTFCWQNDSQYELNLKKSGLTVCSILKRLLPEFSSCDCASYMFITCSTLFNLTSQQPPAASLKLEISCNLLKAIPLAIPLASGWMRIVTKKLNLEANLCI